MSVHVLYRMRDADGQLLYVGLTSNPPARFKNHKFTRHWWHQVGRIDIEHFDSLNDLKVAEQQAIRDERPIYNVHHNTATRADEVVRPNRDLANLDDLCQCDDCGIPGECPWCDVCNGGLEAGVKPTSIDYQDAPVKRPYSLQEIVDAGWAPSVLFLQRHIRSGDIPGHKIGRSWVMDEDEFREFQESTRNVRRQVEQPRHGGLSAVSASRRAS